MAVTDRFAVSLVAGLELDKSTIDKARAQIDAGLGKSSKGVGATGKAAKDSVAETGKLGGVLDRLKRQVSETWHIGGFGRFREDLGKSLDTARSGIDQLGRTLTPMAGLAELASAGGIGLMLNRFASGGAEIGRTAAGINTSTDALQRWRVVGRLFSGDAAAATEALTGFSQVQHAARFGLPAGSQARDTARALGIEGELLRDPETFLKALAGKIRGQAPEVQRAIASAFGVAALLPALRRPKEELEEQLEWAKRVATLNPELLDQAEKLEVSFGKAETMTGHFANTIAGKLTPTFKPLLDGYTGWLEKLENSPGALDKVTAAVEVLAAVIATRLTVSLVALTAAWMASPLGLISLGLLAGAGAAYGMYNTQQYGNKQGQVIDPMTGTATGVDTSGPATDPSGLGTFGKWLRDKGIIGGSAPAPAAVPGKSGYTGPVTPTATSGNWEVMHNNFAGIRRIGVVAGPNAGGFQSYASPEAGIAAIGGLLQRYQDKHGLNTIRGILSRWAPPNENNTESLIARAARVTGFAADQPLDLHDAATQRKMIEAMIRGEQGGKLPPTAAAALDHYVEADRNSHHQVDVNVTGPAGTRAGVAKADGPAALQLRTDWAMVGP